MAWHLLQNRFTCCLALSLLISIPAAAQKNKKPAPDEIRNEGIGHAHVMEHASALMDGSSPSRNR
jgi:hypothetical protein